uniref:Uncharacterized protein n=1 Tax=Candidatus Kentrum sp. MB TaxID=2138164 RepID=A0A450XER2_9GAMM|nr:MAG: hypothetical protein BECKMB1821G_GA0114241_10304 [Candidatus Kentron sp. MB]VFK30259.1 MAG: hypothetical protein BECKMB1821I_GA0114274_101439 [Candidatus Kentron sp. MB]VFK75157.1 MAG: hypothetical protein BECKMB1821H_GA0114242_101639 [Candidatus Kentron sp. MB]
MLGLGVFDQIARVFMTIPSRAGLITAEYRFLLLQQGQGIFAVPCFAIPTLRDGKVSDREKDNQSDNTQPAKPVQMRVGRDVHYDYNIKGSNAGNLYTVTIT